MEKELHAYTDGSCEVNPGRTGWAFVILHEKKEYSASGTLGHGTNNQAEIAGVLEAIKFAYKHELIAGYTKMVIHTDSKYVIQSGMEWIDNWIKRGWTTQSKKKTPVKNMTMWIEFDQLRKEFPIELVYVPAHVGHKYNEMCDVLAKKACYGK